MFKNLLKGLREARNNRVHPHLWLYGSQGYGKSHLLAALVCYLAAQDERVVYIPDCRALLPDPVEYVQAAMLFAWADDITTLEDIMTLTTEDKIRDFFMLQDDVIFVVDEMNADGPGWKEERERLNNWITSFASEHTVIVSCSANNTDFHEQTRHKTTYRVLEVYGGLSNVSRRKIMS
jgi:hypothetical protein